MLKTELCFIRAGWFFALLILFGGLCCGVFNWCRFIFHNFNVLPATWINLLECNAIPRINEGHEFHETCHSVIFIVLVNSHQRWKQTRFRVCFHLWCELTSTMNVTEWQVSWNSCGILWKWRGPIVWWCGWHLVYFVHCNLDASLSIGDATMHLGDSEKVTTRWVTAASCLREGFRGQR